MRIKLLSILLSVLFLIWAIIASGAVVGDLNSGDDHFYNLEYDQAIAAYTQLMQQSPDDPVLYNDIASAELYKVLYRLGLLDSSFFADDHRLARDPPSKPDPSAAARILDMLERGRVAAEAILAHNPRDARALYSLCTDYGLRAAYEFMLEKAWFPAWRNASKAHGYCAQVRKVDPDFIDAYLVLGAYEYVAGSLPLPIRMFAAIGGLRGSKEKGIEYVSRVARQGKYDRNAARVLLSVLYRREGRPLDAATILTGLIADYPRNYLFGLELASMYATANQPERALEILRGLLEKAHENTPGYQELPREVVVRKMQLLHRSGS